MLDQSRIINFLYQPLCIHVLLYMPPPLPKTNNLYFFIYLLRIALVAVDHCKWHLNSKEKQSVHIGFVHQQCASLGVVLGKRIPCILSTNIPSFSFNWIRVVTYGDKIQTCMISPALVVIENLPVTVCVFFQTSADGVLGELNMPHDTANRMR
jgi:hypothetical protein